MNLYISIMVEPKHKIRPGAPSGGQFMLALGGIPRGDSAGPWSDDQRERIEQAVRQWHLCIPEQTTVRHREQRDAVLQLLETGDYSFLFDFSRGDIIDLDSLQNDAEQLYLALKEACQGTDMVATQFTSV